MMTIAHTAETLAGHGSVSLAMGMFDGVHLGHQEVIRKAVAEARLRGGLAAVVTFERHPATVVAPQRAPRLLYSLPQRLRALAELEVGATLLLRFDHALSRQTGEEFIRGLVRDLGTVGSICVGESFCFGYQRSGTVARLRHLGQELGFSVHGMPPVTLDGQVLSSTRIRQAVQAAQFEAVTRMLGRPYALAGTVVPGDHLGRQLGFPTANLEVTGLVLPPPGVYAIRSRVGEGSYGGVLNIGHRPTLEQPTPTLRVEAHLLDFEGDLYGRELEVMVLGALREERRFPSLEALRTQIAADITLARTRWGI